MVTANLTVDQSLIHRDGDSPSTGFILRWFLRPPWVGEADLQILSVNHPGTPGLILVSAAVMEPFSRRLITLSSDDPTVDPRVEFRLLSDHRDMVRMRLAAQELFALLGNKTVRSLTRTVTLDERGTTPSDLTDETALDA
jgi:hypothetical protein